MSLPRVQKPPELVKQFLNPFWNLLFANDEQSPLVVMEAQNTADKIGKFRSFFLTFKMEDLTNYTAKEEFDSWVVFTSGMARTRYAVERI